MDSGTQNLQSKSNNTTDSEENEARISGGTNSESEFLFTSNDNDTQFDSRKLFEELSQIFMDCDAHCNTCVNFIFELNKHIRAAHSKQTTTEDTNFKNEDKGAPDENATIETHSIKVEHIEQSRQLNMSDPDIVDDNNDDDGEELDVTPTIEEHYTCGYCGKKYREQTSLDWHAKRHPIFGQSYKCELCPEEYNLQGKLNIHVKERHTHSHKLKYACKICEERFLIESRLNHHVITKHPMEKGKLVPTCDECGKNFAKVGQLAKHIRVTHGRILPGTKYKTVKRKKGVSGATVESDSIEVELIEHSSQSNIFDSYTEIITVESDEELSRNVTVGMDQTLTDAEENQLAQTVEIICFNCGFCGKKYKRQESLDFHVMTKHHVCVLCGKRFLNKSKLNGHVISTHPKEKVELVPTCRYCGQNYITHTKLRKHIKNNPGHEVPNTEAKSKPQPQTIRTKKVDAREYSKGLTTAGLKCYICGYCGKKCKLKETLKTHIKKKHVELTICVVCDKCFLNKSRLNLHVIQQHPDEKARLVPTCESCEMSFPKTITLTNHMKSCNFREKHFECGTCEKRFYKSESVLQHIEIKHKNVGQATQERFDVKVKVENSDE